MSVGVVEAEINIVLWSDAIEAHVSEVVEVNCLLLEDFLFARDTTTF